MLINHIPKLFPESELKHVEYDKLFEEIKSDSGITQFDHDVWHTSRKQAFQSIEESILNYKTQEFISENKYLYFLIDDNLYYSSMRHSYFQLARKRKK